MKKMGPLVLDRNREKILFRVFAYDKKGVSLVVKGGDKEKIIPMEKESSHIYSTIIEGLGTTPLYKFRLQEEGDFPDPFSPCQPSGVHGFSQVVDHEGYSWKDHRWQGIKQEEMIIYEIHVGTFTPRGTFEGVIEKLDYLLDLGINTIELMPVTQTPGRWNWGYDGVNLFSVNHNYGTPEELKLLVDTCHQKGLSLILDVVYNHLGPEGNYLPRFGPYFTCKHETPWGPAVNYDDRYSLHTREMVLENVRYWREKYHIDGLRLDAVHTIIDNSPVHILQEIGEQARKLADKEGRGYWIIAESDENDVKLIDPPSRGGYGLHGVWMDDFHHCLHTSLTGEKMGYYMDYRGIKDMEKAFKNFIYIGQRSSYWGKPRGKDASQNPGHQFVVALQNHDQVGNRARGERLSSLVEFPYLKAAAGLLLLSPYVPLIFMGEEYGEKNPFLFFTDFQDLHLKKAVSRGRKNEFRDFNWKEVPDPEEEDTFFRSRLTPPQEWKDLNYSLLNLYRDLINLRKNHPALKTPDKEKTRVKVNFRHKVLHVIREVPGKTLTGIFNLGNSSHDISTRRGVHLLNSEWKKYGGKVQGKTNLLLKGNMVLLEGKN
ncbi:MAG: malto-oligosyltrehalose trehalohydrolase [Candidatus Syntrophonatronum acetioxidans]|uniref:Malto-oligosyltrehalose trehalohydrolase n=1 Tax=Candidatus Syntrophonatronum acetioxidans TaxID=1795816 RepID=A0A424YGT0_9FIRM|nr:MAG: malto-oligosyltrehalose trehalohydrolase [Candidatus Syntrophonatronum acetioxidans]